MCSIFFFNKADHNALNYNTFPNKNLEGRGNFVSRLYGFHKMPFQVSINAFLDQICIVGK